MGKAERTIEDVLQEHTPRLSAIKGVVGTAIGSHRGQPCILVAVAEDSPAIIRQIPEQIEGFPVRTLLTGEPSLLDDGPDASDAG